MTDPPQPASVPSPASAAFEELLVRAIESFEVEGHPGVQRLFAAHPDEALELCRKLLRLHRAGLLRGWAGWLPTARAVDGAPTSRPAGRGDLPDEAHASGRDLAAERTSTPEEP